VLGHKLLHKGGFADPRLPSDQDDASLAGCGGVPELRQLFKTLITFQKRAVHNVSSAHIRASVFL
jgi:hypothetical protein